jgi:hypothetical protein
MPYSFAAFELAIIGILISSSVAAPSDEMIRTYAPSELKSSAASL